MPTETITRLIIRTDILDRFGARAARFIADARPGDDLTASVRFMYVDVDTLAHWRAAGLLAGGPQMSGDALPWRCAA